MYRARTRTGEISENAKRSSQPRWYGLLYLLVGFAVLAIALSLYLSHEYMQIFLRSVAVNQVWTERLHDCSQLGQLAAGVNAPGNDVFQSHQVSLEEARMHAAQERFNTQLDAFQNGLRGHSDDDTARTLGEQVEQFRLQMQQMEEEAESLFAHLRSDRSRTAGERMAAMDRRYAQANHMLEQMRGEIAAIQERHFEHQTAAATSLQHFQYGMSLLILAMIGGSAVYGRRVRRQMDAAAQAEQSYIQALRDSEAELDRRVSDRTAELVQANESLRQEIQQRQRAAEALRQSEVRARGLIEVRRQLLKKLMSAQEDERRRIARDLHDEIGQALTSVLIGLRTVADAATLPVARQGAEDLRRVAIAALEEVRRLARGLRPSVLDDLGMAAALERYVADYAQAHAIDVEVDASDLADWRFPEEVETALYRIAQEALTNTAKHAAAQHVRIVLQRTPEGVQLIVSDDGQGFTRRDLNSDGQLGLSGMQERAALLNGSVTVESEPGEGTRVTVRIPCVEATHDENSCALGR